jgi:kynurenine formamidase
MWYYEDREIEESDLEGFIGFVYKITNLKNNKAYIGKKLLKKTRTKKVAGKKRRKKVVTDSDWKDYYGSNEELKNDIQELGEQSFRREILKLCKTKGSVNYWELKYQILNEVLESDSWYNSWIYVRVHKSHIES